MTKKFIVQWAHIQRKFGNLSDPLIDPAGAQTWAPNTDVCEGSDEVIVRMELAGATLENLEIYLEEKAVIVRGVRQDPACEDSAAGFRFRQLEIEYGPFQRIIPLPFAADGDTAKASIRNGILEIRLPRTHTPRQTTINVTVES